MKSKSEENLSVTNAEPTYLDKLFYILGTMFDKFAFLTQIYISPINMDHNSDINNTDIDYSVKLSESLDKDFLM